MVSLVIENELILPNVPRHNVWCEQAFLGDVRTCQLHTNFNQNLTITLWSPGVDGNPLSTRFHWPESLHQYFQRHSHYGEEPGTSHFQLYPRRPQTQNVALLCFQRAMLSNIQQSLSCSVSNFTGSRTSVRAEDASSIAATNTTEAAVALMRRSKT